MPDARDGSPGYLPAGEDFGAPRYYVRSGTGLEPLGAGGGAPAAFQPLIRGFRP
ncbi:hypothetical protein THITH_11510 [Thioalkalivibrio paradoxus ARh 1]|uniref:Uncharacterized protein n=1 Tax=Thioalkalivibrio paradoxus ARh 1 TaxID=713585 RepID=W0DTK5_9GAMM|nr:hypothetical protein THITH_11510 [Thioalkalivibrio paradoxus ARh 1]